MRVLVFLGFLIVYVGQIVALVIATWLTLKGVKRLTPGRMFLLYQVLLVVGAGAFIGYFALLTGYFDLKFAIFLIAGSEISVLISMVAYPFLATSREQLQANTFAARIWFQNRFMAASLWRAIVFGVIGLATFLGYPIVMGIVLFSHQRPSDELTRLVFTWTAAYLTIAFPIASTQTLNLLSAENLDERIRLGALIESTASMVPTSLYFALLLSGAGITGPGFTLIQGSVPVIFSPLLVIAVVVAYLLVVGIPFALGSQRGKLWRITISKEKRDWVANVINVLLQPPEETYPDRLEKLRQGMQDEISRLKQGDSPFEAHEPKADPDEIQLGFDLRVNAVDIDVTSRYVRWLSDRSSQIEDMESQLKSTTDENERRKSAESWTNLFKDQRQELDTDATKVAKDKSSLAVVWATLASPVPAAILSGLGKWLWDTVQHSFLH